MLGKETKSQMANSMQMPGMQRPKSLKKKVLLTMAIVVFIAVAAVAVYSSLQLYRIKSPGYQEQIIEKQTKDIINAVGKLIELPSDTPQVATVTDVDTLKKNQPFFDSAKNGDQILIFQKEVILYRPSINKIINVGPIISTPAQTTTGQTPAGPTGSTTSKP